MQRLNEKNINDPQHFNERFNGTVGLFDIKRFERLARYFEGGSYLDVGAFDSIMPMLLAERFPKSDIYVVDFADEIMKFMQERFDKVKFITHDIRKGLPFEDSSLDYVVAGEVIEHMENPKDFVNELLRVCKVGGIVAISTPHKEIERDDKIGGEFHLWSYDEEDLRDLLGRPADVELLMEGRYNTMLAWKRKE